MDYLRSVWIDDMMPSCLQGYLDCMDHARDFLKVFVIHLL